MEREEEGEAVGVPLVQSGQHVCKHCRICTQHRQSRQHRQRDTATHPRVLPLYKSGMATLSLFFFKNKKPAILPGEVPCPMAYPSPEAPKATLSPFWNKLLSYFFKEKKQHATAR